mgnify:CR=1 FL=1
MNLNNFQNLKNKSNDIGNEMYQLIEKLFPICRSITGNGVRKTLEILNKEISLEIHEIATGTKVFDWTIPKEWNIDDAYIIDPNGEKIVDFKKSNLHVVNYSIPVNQKISLSKLKKHIHTIPEKPDWIPYVTSYYSETWGFCMTHNKFLNLKEGEYTVVINSKLEPGSLTYGEFLIPGKSTNEILLTCYICHPSMCNDNLSGVSLLTMIAKYMKNFDNNYSIRFLFIPETIGSITWLNNNENNLSKIKHGLVATCIGDNGNFTYKKTRRGNTELDITVKKILEESKKDYKIIDFFPYGSDERQFCSPGFNLSVGSLLRSIYGGKDFLEYHTSADNLNFMNKNSLSESFLTYISIILELEKNFDNNQQEHNQQEHNQQEHNQQEHNQQEHNQQEHNQQEHNQQEHNQKFLNLNPKCEPQLGKRGIYHQLGGQVDKLENRDIELAIFWILNLSDGINSLNEISEKSGISIKKIKIGIEILINSKIIKKIENGC